MFFSLAWPHPIVCVFLQSIRTSMGQVFTRDHFFEHVVFSCKSLSEYCFSYRVITSDDLCLLCLESLEIAIEHPLRVLLDVEEMVKLLLD